MLLMLPSSTIGRVLFVLAVCIAIVGAMALRRRLLRHRLFVLDLSATNLANMRRHSDSYVQDITVGVFGGAR